MKSLLEKYEKWDDDDDCRQTHDNLLQCADSTKTFRLVPEVSFLLDCHADNNAEQCDDDDGHNVVDDKVLEEMWVDDKGVAGILE